MSYFNFCSHLPLHLNLKETFEVCTNVPWKPWKKRKSSFKVDRKKYLALTTSKQKAWRKCAPIPALRSSSLFLAQGNVVHACNKAILISRMDESALSNWLSFLLSGKCRFGLCLLHNLNSVLLILIWHKLAERTQKLDFELPNNFGIIVVINGLVLFWWFCQDYQFFSWCFQLFCLFCILYSSLTPGMTERQ